MIPIRVLIIDDSVTIRAMLEHIILKDAGCQVIGVAVDVASARTLMAETRPDVVTLDLTMPGIDGLQYLHDIAGERHPPIIVVSSRSKTGADETLEAAAAGAVACFDKATLLADAPRFLRLLKKAAQSKPIPTKRAKARVQSIAGSASMTPEAVL